MTEVSAWDFFYMGGPMMWPILLCSIASSAVFFQKIFFLASVLKNLSTEEHEIMAAVSGNKIMEAIHFTDRQPSISGVIFKAGLLKYATSKSEMADAIEEAARRQVPYFEQGMILLLSAVSILPLLGFLGGVIGFYEVFHSTAIHAQAVNPILLTDAFLGLRQALISGFTGLFLGLIALVAYNFLVNSIRHALQRIEYSAENLVDALTTPISISAKM